MVGANGSNQIANVTTSKLTFNAATGALSASGNITGANLIATGSFVVIPVSDTDPASPVTGALYYNTALGGLKLYTGSGWDNV
jgi:hypothetical protein